MKLDEIKQNHVRFEFQTMTVKVKILKTDTVVQFAIGLSRPDFNDYENFITKIGKVVNGEVIIKERLIENPPFNFYKKYLLKEGNLNAFYEALEKHILKAKKDSTSTEATFIKREKSDKKDYILTFRNLNGNKMSEKMKNKVKYMFGNEVLKFCEKHQLTAVFTSDPNRAKIEKVHNILENY